MANCGFLLGEPRVQESDATGTLYIVASPIGNLEDMSPRGVSVLMKVDMIAAEDTRHSRRLTEHFGVATRLVSLHEFNERDKASTIVARLEAGEHVALVSDAGTPLISDPGYHLVKAARQAGIRVVPVPGACAITVALSAAGLPTDRFCFEGFLPAKKGQRRKALLQLQQEARTLVFYESPHRILESVQDMAEVLGGDREAVLARELTKQYESFYSGSLSALGELLAQDENHRRGEFVVMLRGSDGEQPSGDFDADTLFAELLEDLPLKKAAAILARMTGKPRKLWYDRGLAMKAEGAS